MAAAIQVTVEFPLRVVVYPAPDLKGQWIAHGLETDVVTQGDSPEHAIEMMGDAMKTFIEYATRRRLLGPHGLPFVLHPAPREVWDLIGESVPSGITVRASVARAGTKNGPSAWPLYSFVSNKPPAFANAG